MTLADFDPDDTAPLRATEPISPSSRPRRKLRVVPQEETKRPARPKPKPKAKPKLKAKPKPKARAKLKARSEPRPTEMRPQEVPIGAPSGPSSRPKPQARGRKPVRRPAKRRPVRQRIKRAKPSTGSGVLLGWTGSLVAWLLILTAAIWIWPALGPRTDLPADDSVAAPAPARFYEIAPVERYGTLVERRLFSSTRRPPAQAVPTAVDPRAALSAYEFQGTAMFETGQLAFFWDRERRFMLRLQAGQTLADWTVERIEPRRVTFALGDRRTTLTFTQ